MRCVLLGTSEFAISTAEALLKLFPPISLGEGVRGGGFIGIITKPDEPAGRGRTVTPPPLATWATQHSVRCWQPSTKVGLTTLLRELKPDVAAVVAYGKIIPPESLAIPQFGFVNLHPSLLPKYRGPSPIQSAIANGDTETGVTLMLLDEQVDHGPIIAQERVPLSPTATRTSLERELAERGASLLERTLLDYLAGRITPQPQDDSKATTTPLLSRDHGRIDWHEPAAAIERKVRAYEGWPGTWCQVPSPSHRGGVGGGGTQSTQGAGRRLKILSATVDGPTNETPGTIVQNDGALNIACGDGNLLTLLTVQPEGKPTMNGAEFLRGHRSVNVLE